MSLGNFRVGWSENSVRIASEIFSIPQIVSCAESLIWIFGRNRMENHRPLPRADSQRLPRGPRPAVWCSAKRTKPSVAFALATCKIASFVEPVCSSTTIRLPIVAQAKWACSSSAISRSRFSAWNMAHFEREIDRARGVRKRADGNVIHSRRRRALHIFQRDAAACLELNILSSQRHSLANLRRCHVVEQDNVYAV